MWSTLAISDLVSLEIYPTSTKYPIEEFVHIVCDENDWQFAIDILWQLEEMAIVYKRWSISLNAALPFLEFNHPKVRAFLLYNILHASDSINLRWWMNSWHKMIIQVPSQRACRLLKPANKKIVFLENHSLFCTIRYLDRKNCVTKQLNCIGMWLSVKTSERR